MMLRFQWDGLRRGDHILVHDVGTPDLGLRPAMVILVDSTGPRRDIAARYMDGPGAGRVVRPGRFASHLDPLTAADVGACWRCAGEAAA